MGKIAQLNTLFFFIGQLFRILLARTDEVFIPLKEYEAPVNFHPNLVAYPKPQNGFLLKAEHLESEDLFFVSYGERIFFFKKNNSNIFSLASDYGFFNISFSLMKGESKMLVIGKQSSEQNTSILIFDWRLRTCSKNLTQIGGTFTDIIHISGTSFAMLYNEEIAYLVDVNKGDLKELDKFEKGAKKCIYVDNLRKYVICIFSYRVKICELQHELSNCFDKLFFNFPIKNVLHLKENIIVLHLIGAAPSEMFSIYDIYNKIEVPSAFPDFPGNTFPVNKIPAFLLTSEPVLLKSDAQNVGTVVAYNEDSFYIDSQDNFFNHWEITETLYDKLNEEADILNERCYAYIKIDDKKGFVINKNSTLDKYQYQREVSSNHIYKRNLTSGTQDFLISKEPNYTFIKTDLTKLSEVNFNYTIEREVYYFDFLDNQIILMTPGGFEVFGLSNKLFMHFNISIYNSSYKLQGFTIFNSKYFYRTHITLVLLIYETCLQLTIIQSGVKLVTFPFLSYGNKSDVHYFEPNAQIFFFIIDSKLLRIIRFECETFNVFNETTLELKEYNFYDFLENGVAVGFDKEVHVFKVNKTSSQIEHFIYTVPQSISKEYNFRFGNSFIVSFSHHLTYHFSRICYPGYTNVSGFCLKSCDNQNDFYLEISTNECVKSCPIRNATYFNQKVCDLNCPKNCVYCSSKEEGCLECEVGYFRRNTSCLPCSNVAAYCLECSQNFCFKYSKLIVPPKTENSLSLTFIISISAGSAVVLVIIFALIYWKCRRARPVPFISNSEDEYVEENISDKVLQKKRKNQNNLVQN